MRQIYLDYNATTPMAPAVVDAMLPFLKGHYANPSSPHLMGRAANEAIEDARLKIARLLGCDGEEIIFTGCGTESNNLALKGLFLKGEKPRGHLVISSIEHAAVSAPAEFLKKFGVEVSIVGCDSNGVVSPAAIERVLRPNTRLVSLMHSNNEIGTLQPIAEIVSICHERQILVHSDAVQSIGKVPVNVADLDLDMLSLSGHKFYGPKGVGALFVRTGLELEPLLHGTAQEQNRRAGTHHTAGIVGMGRAADLAGHHLDEHRDRVEELRNRLQRLLVDAVPDLVVHGIEGDRLPNTLSVAFPEVSGEELLQRIPELFASLGSACHHGGKGGSATLRTMGCDPQTMAGTIRLSLGRQTSDEEVELAASWMIESWERLTDQ